ncbi:MAG: hypothetical protein M1817_005311 [Caeruleum heppii]|nr:MAG: hypothetical protein M1817_005311 [Caeruleum heppii]
MAASLEAPSQHKQPSRKGKKAWRKNVDLSRVQEGLENVRDEVIKGGIIAEKPSDELFTLDTAGDESISKANYKIHKPLKADEILGQRSAVPAVDSRKRSASKVTDGVLEPSTKKRRSGGVSQKELERLKRLAVDRQGRHKQDITTHKAPEYDPWAEHAVEVQIRDPRFSFLEPPPPLVVPKTLKHAPISLAANGQQIPAVQAPAAEVSYNPQSQAYFDAYIKAGEAEIAAERKRLREAEEERQMLERAALAAQEREESSSEDNDESAWEGLDSDAEGAEWLNRRRPERKTQAQRNKIQRRKEAERRVKMQEHAKKRDKQAAEVHHIVKVVEAKERALALIRDQGVGALAQGDDKVLRRRKFGKYPVPQAPLELVLPDELQDSLRLLKPEGNLLKDRFRSILVRGKVETRRPITQPKKAQMTVTEKWTYKDWTLK